MKAKAISGWTHVLLEAYCFYGYLSEKKHKSAPGEINEKTGEMKRTGPWKTYENKEYVSPSKRPAWCRKENKRFFPQYKCLATACPFFNYTDAGAKDYRWMNRKYHKRVSRK